MLIPGLTCAQLFRAPRSGVLVDGRDFYRAVYDACSQAERSIVMLGWQFESDVKLVRGEDADGCELPARLIEFLRALCDAKPELEVHILAWDSSAVFALEREPLQRLMFRLKGHHRIHYVLDNTHPFGASHHQKLIVVDRSVAFLGGMDICRARWDDRTHDAENPDRVSRYGKYEPYHDVQAYVTGEAVDVLRGWFRDRWQRATGNELYERSLPRRELAINSTFDVTANCIGLVRTWPRTIDPPAAPIHEIYELHLRAIALAERVIYFENQYLSSHELCFALETRMAQGGLPLEIVFVLPEKSSGLKERISIGVYQGRILERLTRAAEVTGHHFGVYYSAATDEVPVFIHAKVLAVDDRFLLVSSANGTNRSMGFDTELGLAWEAQEPNDSLRRARIELLAEHCGLDCTDATLGPIDGLVARLDTIARSKQHRLRLHRRNEDEIPGPLLARLIPDETPFDPEDAQTMERLLPEPGAWLDRLIREPLSLLKRATRELSSRFVHRLQAGFRDRYRYR
jgi:phosphatidylserine/phosphatidylglycerophosphate/cardiolipin synthase-like enzyme